MAAKAHMRNGNPLVLAISQMMRLETVSKILKSYEYETNILCSIWKDDYVKKPNSMVVYLE